MVTSNHGRGVTSALYYTDKYASKEIVKEYCSNEHEQNDKPFAYLLPYPTYLIQSQHYAAILISSMNDSRYSVHSAMNAGSLRDSRHWSYSSMNRSSLKPHMSQNPLDWIEPSEHLWHMMYTLLR